MLSLMYASAWLAFLQPSQVLWFIPAGLRLAVLWLLPSRRWAWLLLAEGLVACYLVDRRVYPRHGLAGWLTLRFRLTAVAALACFLGAAGS